MDCQEPKCKYCKIIIDFAIENKEELKKLGAKSKNDLHLLWEEKEM